MDDWVKIASTDAIKRNYKKYYKLENVKSTFRKKFKNLTLELYSFSYRVKYNSNNEVYYNFLRL